MRKTECLAMILAGGQGSRLGALTKKIAKPAVPFGGKYRIIDFPLSNCANSGIDKVGVLTQYRPLELHNYLASGSAWDLDKKEGGVFILPPYAREKGADWYRGTADAIYQNLSFLKSSHEPYVVIASADCVYKLDFNKVLEYHIEKKADITVVCKDMDPDANVDRYGTVKLDDDCRIEDFEEKAVVARSNTISCGIYIIRRRLLVEMIEKCAEEDRYDFVRDILIRYKGQKRIYGYKISDYWKNIASVNDYFSANMDFLKPEVRDYFFKTYPDIYSKVDDLPPAKYNVGAKIMNSLVASGTIVNGTVEDSVIFRQTFIGNNCTIKNSIILNDVYIGDNSYIENCIVESHGTIRANSYHKGENGIEVVVEHTDRYVM